MFIDNDMRFKIETPNGTFVGHENNCVAEFLGIRYGNLKRWEPPTDVITTKEDIFICDTYSPSGIQVVDRMEKASLFTQSEDNLQLNIWTKDIYVKSKPVMVWIHGGGAIAGGTYDPLYRGENYVRALQDNEDVVFVNFNYRLGVLGLINLESLSGYSDRYQYSMNLATLDQIHALKWVQNNIAYFGGDPENVTVFGQSSGSSSIAALLTIPEGRKYFQRAICHSGNLFERQISVEKAKEYSKMMLDILGCKTMDEALALKDYDIKHKLEGIYENFDGPALQRVADGITVPVNGFESLLNGDAANICLMLGNTNGETDRVAVDRDNFPQVLGDEGKIFGLLELTSEMTRGAATGIDIRTQSEAITAYLNADPDNDRVKRMMDLTNDLFYIKGNTMIAEAQSKWSDKVFLYQWNWAPDMTLQHEIYGKDCWYSPYGRAAHCTELPFVLKNLDAMEECSGPSENMPKLLSDQMHKAWYSFAKKGDPNNELIPVWNSYNETDRQVMYIDEVWTLVKDPKKEDRLLLKQIKHNGCLI